MTLVKRLMLVVVAALVLGACRVDIHVGVKLNTNGSGVVTVKMGVDDDTLAREPGIAGEVRTDDLKIAGWQVVGPAKGEGGLTWLTLTKPFANAKQATEILNEISGSAGIIRKAVLGYSAPFGRIESSFSATIDPSGGINSFADGDLVAALGGGRPLDPQLKSLEAEGKSLDQILHLTVSVQLPGDGGKPLVWTPKLAGAPSPLKASSTEYHYIVLLLLAVSIGLFVLLAIMTVAHLLFGWGRRL
jgi:hypothetical protein